MIVIKVESNFDEGDIQEWLERMQQSVLDHAAKKGGELANWMEQTTAGQVKPDVERTERAVEIKTVKPLELKAAKQHRIYERAWAKLPGLLREA